MRLLERGAITPSQAIELAANIEGGKVGLLDNLGGGQFVPLAIAAAVAFLFFRGR